AELRMSINIQFTSIRGVHLAELIIPPQKKALICGKGKAAFREGQRLDPHAATEKTNLGAYIGIYAARLARVLPDSVIGTHQECIGRLFRKAVGHSGKPFLYFGGDMNGGGHRLSVYKIAKEIAL